MTGPAITVHGLGKEFRRYSSNRPSKIKHLVMGGLMRRSSRKTFWCLRDITFEVQKGQMLGIIGPNGSGKSTLLRLIGGVGRPDRGHLSVKGRIGALFDLGAGFHQDLDGRDNIYISGVVSGLTRKQISERFDDIVAFSELGNYLDNPLRTYSSGMKMRLAFAVAINIDPDILLIDEILYVGDLGFQSKCLEQIQLFKKRGCTILLVSHDLVQVENLCDSVVWIKNGHLAGHGAPKDIIQAYTQEINNETRKRTPSGVEAEIPKNGTNLRLNENRFGSLEVEITAIRIVNPNGDCVDVFHVGDPLRIEIDYTAHAPVEIPIFGVTISKEDGQICCEMMFEKNRFNLVDSQRKGSMRLDVERLDLTGGEYFLDIGIYEKNWEFAYDYHWHVYPLHIVPTCPYKGILQPPHKWEWSLGSPPDNGH